MSMDPARASRELVDTLRPAAAPIAIRFLAEAPEGVPVFAEDAAEGPPVAAGCVFWMHAGQRTFATKPADHANCSVGSYTHGLVSLGEAAGQGDVAALVDAGWVAESDLAQVPAMAEKPGAIVYGPLAEAPDVPDVVFLRLNAKGAMVLKDAWPHARTEGKPQCHIIPIAARHGEVAMSLGCMVSRVRTGMGNEEMTAAIPGHRLGEVVDALTRARAADEAVAAYAAQDMKAAGTAPGNA